MKQQTFVEPEFPADDFPAEAPEELINGDERTFSEIHAADKDTVATRKKASAFAAAFNAVMRRAGIIRACNELKIDPNEIMRLYLTLIDAAQRTEYLAELNGAPCSKTRRFKCGMSTLELFFKRTTIPPDLTDEAKQRHIDTLARTARRRWNKIHILQRHLHLGLFVHEKGDASGAKKIAGHFTDHLSDLLADTARRAAKLRGEPINRYNRAADEALAHFRETVPDYAPEWTPETTETPPATKTESKKKPARADSWEKIKIATKQLVDDALRVVREQGLTEDESFARRQELQEFIETAWVDAHPSPPLSSPVSVNADTPQNEPVSVPSDSNLDRTNLSYLNDAEGADLLEKTEIPSGVEASNFQLSDAPEDHAVATIEALESVGANRYKVVFLSTVPIGGKANEVGSEDATAEEVKRNAASYIQRSERQAESVCLRPMNPQKDKPREVCSSGALIQIDDCDTATLERFRPFAFKVIETSPGSFQPWLALPFGTTEGERVATRERLLRQLKDTGANGGAYNSVRMPGGLNCKDKYKAQYGEYPRVRLVDVALGRTVTPLELEQAGLLAPVEAKRVVQVNTPRSTSSNLPSHWPDFNEFLQRKWLDAEDRPDRSSAEISWAMAALRMGWPHQSVVTELSRLSLKGADRRDNYTEKTVDAAARLLAASPPRSAYFGSARERMTI